ncbi:hypothetical protein HHK36_023782 [Tetracentron sinense]|uniref:Gnk2-homologous domain-containing protein n=1 Tax=Tetracentron sinense TaxID=13715 RepID=A0A834YT26_TETSI|nr:hypothetical protein HHK36_023782 [Tetracentron sinense]
MAKFGALVDGLRLCNNLGLTSMMIDSNSKLLMVLFNGREDPPWSIEYRPFERNLNLLLLESIYNEGWDSGFYKNTEGEDPDRVYGLFLCRGDVSFDVCQNCTKDATQNIVKQCPGQKSAIIWYDECLIRYSNTSFFSIMTETPGLFMWNTQNVSEPDRFNKTLSDMFKVLANQTAFDPSIPMYATGRIEVSNFSDFEKLYGLAQCTQDLSRPDCYRCLGNAISTLLEFCYGMKGGRVLGPSCSVRYEVYPFTEDPKVAAPPPTLIDRKYISQR